MPIRFTCHRCEQRLSVAARKAGTTTTCPRCRAELTIPEAPAETSDHADKRSPIMIDAPEVVAAEESGTLAGPVASFHLASDLPQAGGDPNPFAGWQGVGEAARPARPLPPPRLEMAVIVVPRRVVYLQGILLAAAALMGLLLGMLLGATFATRPHAAAQATPCRVTGSVRFAAGTRLLPDVGAVVILVPPVRHKPDEKVPIASVRPSEALADDNVQGATILKNLGGGYARTDASGRFEIDLPAAGRYLMLVLSHRAKSRGAEGVSAADVVRIKPFFDAPVALLTGHQHYLADAIIQGDQELPVEFR